MMMNKKYFIAALLLLISFRSAHAAVITLGPSAIAIDTQGQSVNAVEFHLTFDPREFLVKSIDDGGSVVDVWVVPPTFSNDAGTIDLSGIIPGGITTANGKIVSLSVIPKGPSIAKGFSLESGQVLANDGKGTPAALSIKNLPFISAVTGNTTSGPPDLTAPDVFTPQVARSSDLFNGSYFVSFAATDQGSGMDHYEVLEVPQGTGIGNIVSWQKASSPYLLTDQTLGSDIYIRAVDRAGNFRTVKIPAANPAGVSMRWWGWTALAAGFGILLVGSSLISWKRKKRRG